MSSEHLEAPAQRSGEPRADADAATRAALGRRLHELRLERGLTLRQAATRAGLSHTFIRMIEQGEREIAISRLIRLADGYGVMMSDLLSEPRVPASEPEFTGRDEGRALPTAAPGISIEYLSSAAWPMQPFIVRLEPHSALEQLAHPGIEFLHCVAGRPTLVVDGVAHAMRAGDTLFIPERTTHSYLNRSSRPARIVGAVHRSGIGDDAIGIDGEPR